MKLSPTAGHYKHRKTILTDSYKMAKDICYLYFKPRTYMDNNTEWELKICGCKVEDYFYCGRTLSELNELLNNEIVTELNRRTARMKDKNKQVPYRMIVFTNNIKILKNLNFTFNNFQIRGTDCNHHFNGCSISAYSDNFDFRLITPFCLNQEDVYFEENNVQGALGIEHLINFVANAYKVKPYKVEYSLGNVAKKMANRLIASIKKWPRLIAFSKSKEQDERNKEILNMLQSVNCSGIIHTDKDVIGKKCENVLSIDISSAYQSVMTLEPIFPLAPLDRFDIPVKGYKGRYSNNSIKEKIMNKIELYDRKNYWYFICIQPNCKSGEYEAELKKYDRYFRRDVTRKHKEHNTTYLDCTQVINFMCWDLKWINIEEEIDSILDTFRSCKISFIYSKRVGYLPKEFRTFIYDLYKKKSSTPKGINRDITKTGFENLYGKGLQYKDYNEDNFNMKTITNSKEFNIAMSLTCCSYIRYRLMTDFIEFSKLFKVMDTDGLKAFGTFLDTFRLKQAIQEKNKLIEEKQVKAGFDITNMGKWLVEDMYKLFMAFGPKQYIGLTTTNEPIIALAGCRRDISLKYVKSKSVESIMDEYINNGIISIPYGHRYVSADNESTNIMYEYSSYTIKKTDYV